MSDLPADDLIREIHATPTRLVLAITGGGSGAMSRLLQVGGASRTVLEAVVPYAAAALDDWLGAPPEHYCDDRTARAMAMAAFERARRWTPDGTNSNGGEDVAGIGCTASLVSDRPKRGAHRAHVAVQTARFTAIWSVELVASRRSRVEEERVVADLVLNAVAAACGLAERIDSRLQADEPVTHARTEATRQGTELLLGRRDCFEVHSSAVDRPPSGGAVFPGAFNPRHDGHRRMAALAAERTGRGVIHEISIANVDKPLLDFIELDHRIRQFAADEPLWFTRAATFREKADIFPGATFVVGADTVERIADLRYYGGDEQVRDAAVEHLAERGCRFLVFGRLVGERFETLPQIALPPALARLCDEVAAGEFREDVSSTQLRRQASDSAG
jgi:hypothetical protein